MEKLDLLIKNGVILDPSRNTNRTGDIAVKNGKIVESEGRSSLYEIDASGKLVMPGLIDFHAHIFYGGSDFALAPDSFAFACGTTTIVDPGTAGVANYRAFRAYAATQATRIKALLYVGSTGLGTLNYHENADPACWDRDGVKKIYEEYRGDLLGLKIRQSKDIVGSLGLKPLDETLKLAGEIGCRTVVHVTNPPTGLEQIAAKLRPDDVFCHVFQGTGNTILCNGKVHPAIWQARERGVLFDASNGKGHFSFEVAETAIKEGFIPDILSSDLTTMTLYKDYAFALPHLMAKYLYLGLTIEEVVRMVTIAPAQAMGLESVIGTLAFGACADVAIFSLKEMNVEFKDTLGEKRMGKKMFVPEMTLREGRIVFRNFNFI
ncbi:MAG: amidohydrolase family protein [Synergistaceae bacterium]|nr:amidohydrolase family protein [Synergistaceae bacterium]